MTPTVVFDSSKITQQDTATARVLNFDANDNQRHGLKGSVPTIDIQVIYVPSEKKPTTPTIPPGATAKPVAISLVE